MSGPLTVKTFGMSDRGLTRTSNEDQFLIAELTKTMRIWQTTLPETRALRGDERGHVFLVADGMGGHAGGERASELTVLAIQQFTLNTLKWFLEPDRAEAQQVLSQFQRALREADAQVRHEAEEHRELRGMGTTMTLAYHLDAQLCIVHVGDSRAYVYRDDELHQLTRDHTLIADLVSSGAVKPQDVAGHRLRHVITNVIGGTEAGVHVESHALLMQPGDRLLICSDGLTEMVPDATILATLRAEIDPEPACRQLIDLANAAGGRDNVTVVLVRFDAPVETADAPA
jgi:serine/threonine protein phosphatase PrpC